MRANIFRDHFYRCCNCGAQLDANLEEAYPGRIVLRHYPVKYAGDKYCKYREKVFLAEPDIFEADVKD